jgi:hypothetical protein
MQLIYLSPTTDFNEVDLTTVEARNQNKYGTMHTFKEKLELVTSEQVTDYYIYQSKEDKDKVYLCVKSLELTNALQTICRKLTEDGGHAFKPEKEALYIKMNAEQAATLPKDQQLNISVKIYGVFYQSSSKHSFLQMELTGFKSYPLVHFT